MISPQENYFLFCGLNIRYYSLIMFFALLFSFLYTIFIIKKAYKDVLDVDFFLDLFPVLVISGILGARIYYVILCLKYFIRYPFEIFAIWHGGISIHGGIIFGTFAGFLYSIKRGENPLIVADAIAPAISLGQAIGRWGNYYNSEAFGFPTSLPWGLYIAPNYRPFNYMNFEFFHPTFLYESILDFLIFIILSILVIKIGPKARGRIFCLYLILYSIVRFLIEKIRVDSVMNINDFSVAQIASLALFLVGITGIILIRKNND